MSHSLSCYFVRPKGVLSLASDSYRMKLFQKDPVRKFLLGRHGILTTWFTMFCLVGMGQSIIPCGHSHNDYLQERPLFDALDNGFTSIEVDLFLRKGRLVVSHVPTKLNSKKDLEELYLQPLDSIMRARVWEIYPQHHPIYLYLDIKTPGQPWCVYLGPLVAKYKKLFRSMTNPDGPMILLMDEPCKELPTMLSKTGSLEDIGSEIPVKKMPRVHAKYGQYFKYKGKGEMSEKERVRLRDYVKRANEKGRGIRFYAAGDDPKIWKELLDAGVHWINVDDLEGFRKFYLQWKGP